MFDDRKKIWIDSIQTRLFVRLGLYWLTSQLCLLTLVFLWRFVQEGPGQTLEQYGSYLQDFAPAIFASLLLVPMLAWDSIRFAHRIVGPLHRLRTTMHALANGEAIQPIRLRFGDMLTEVCDDFNRLLETLQHQGLLALTPSRMREEDAERRTA
jgi:hypothetical protein